MNNQEIINFIDEILAESGISAPDVTVCGSSQDQSMPQAGSINPLDITSSSAPVIHPSAKEPVASDLDRLLDWPTPQPTSADSLDGSGRPNAQLPTVSDLDEILNWLGESSNSAQSTVSEQNNDPIPVCSSYHSSEESTGYHNPDAFQPSTLIGQASIAHPVMTSSEPFESDQQRGMGPTIFPTPSGASDAGVTRAALKKSINSRDVRKHRKLLQKERSPWFLLSLLALLASSRKISYWTLTAFRDLEWSFIRKKETYQAAVTPIEAGYW